MKGVKRTLAAVYNFFNMFHKDKGAHFSYNIGVSMMRIGLLCFAFAVLLVAEFFLLDSPRITKKDEVKAMVTSCSMDDTGTIGEVSFYGIGEDGYTFRQTQHCTWGGYRLYSSRSGKGKAYTYTRYSVSGRDDYISYHNRFFVSREYYWAYPNTPPPVPIWGIPVALAFMLVFFYMGRKQINVSMKYPRTDVPTELSGAPVVSGAAGFNYDDPELREEAERTLARMKERAESLERDPIHTPPPEDMFDSADSEFSDRPFTGSGGQY